MKFCTKPFEQIHLDPNGGCRLCAWTDESIGDLTKQGLSEVWNSENANKIREAVKSGNYEFCRKTSCHYLENDSLPDMDDDYIKKYQPEELPVEYSVACDFICNHSCPSCRNQVFVPDEDYKKKLKIILDKILPALNSKTTKRILTDGNGDCFASPYIMDMLEHLHPENPSCSVNFETNGVLFDEEHWKKISHLDKFHIGVTVTPNSFEPSTFKYLNGGHDTYSQMIHNLGFMRDLKRAGKINRLSVSFVVQERNFWQLPEFTKRCFEEFEADEVIVKPLYRWFMLSQDDYWYKDVYNPAHPYHREFLEMLKSPIFNNPNVFFWGGHNLHKCRPHPAYIYKEHMEITERLLDDSMQIKLRNVMNDLGTGNIYIYGDTSLSSVFYKALQNVGINAKGFIARDICRTSICGQKVICFNECNPDDADTIVVMNYDFIEKIKQDFHFRGFYGKIISVKELMDNVR